MKLLLYVKTNLESYKTNPGIHQNYTRKTNNLSIILHSTSLYNPSFIYTDLQKYNVLPDDLKEGPLLRFKHTT